MLLHRAEDLLHLGREAREAFRGLAASNFEVVQLGRRPAASPAPAPIPVSVGALGVSPASLVGGQSSTGTMTLSGPAPTGGVVVTLSSANPAVARTPASVSVGVGASSAAFTHHHLRGDGHHRGGHHRRLRRQEQDGRAHGEPGAATPATSAARAAVLKSLTLSPTSVVRGASSTGRVTLAAAAPTGGVVITLKSSRTSRATVPASVTVPAGKSTATFAVSTPSSASQGTATITGMLTGAAKTATLTVKRR